MRIDDLDLISGNEVIEYITDALCLVREGETLAEIFNSICSAKVKYIGDDLFELTYAENMEKQGLSEKNP
jgi:hypothetical protein